MATLTQTLSDEAIEVLADEFDKKIEIVHAADDVEAEPDFEDADEDLVERPPVVTIMGHVDHGKTSLLDAIRETEVAAGEAGGITQHIGAYQVHHDGKAITFLDTPGHEAFTAMRARGAKVTDIAVIVVAADDGVMPQTEEAIDHAKAADVPIIVAVNKIDKEGARPDPRAHRDDRSTACSPSEWGGDTEFVDVSAKTKAGPRRPARDDPASSPSSRSCKANPDAEASGVVIESKLDPGRGPVVDGADPARHAAASATRSSPAPHWGRVRAMHDYRGERVKRAPRPASRSRCSASTASPRPASTCASSRTTARARQLAGERAQPPEDRGARAPLGPQGLARGRLQARPGGRASRSSTSSSRPTSPARSRRSRTRSPSCRRTRSRSTSSTAASAASTSPT